MVRIEVLLGLIIVVAWIGCAGPDTNIYYDEIVPYKRYRDNGARDERDVPLNWKVVKENLSKKEILDYTSYYELEYGQEYKDINSAIDMFNQIDFIANDTIMIENHEVQIELSYGAKIYSAKITEKTKEYYDVFYYPEPLIGVHFISVEDSTKSNTLYYCMDGEIAGESGEWFLDADRDELAQFYFNEMISMIGEN